jgi:hypothetical protein
VQRREAEQLLYEADGRESATFRAYRRLRAEYERARADLEAAESARPTSPHAGSLAPMADAPLRRRANASLQRWLSLGHKHRVEAALRVLGKDTGAAADD